MTVGSAPAPTSAGADQQRQAGRGAHTSAQQASGAPTSGKFQPSAAFQQVKQTQASLARLTRVHPQLQCATGSQPSAGTSAANQPQPPASTATASKTTTFVDCLIRRFKDCFSEDCCTVPMFVVGSLSPGSDGTHLILPPCVSLGRQSMSRFASPKNLRHMSSIRDSCKSIEELDLGGNKLNDLIEVYKILQCTPNLKFLNLSENDLSRTSPVAMANSPNSTSSFVTSPSQAPPQIAFGSSVNWSAMNFAAPTSSARSCLAPLNQNQHPLGGRRHSTLGQSSSPPSSASLVNTTRATRLAAASRVAEARRLAATNALAQSKKTSSMVANKLAASASARSIPSSASHLARPHVPTSSSTSALGRLAASDNCRNEVSAGGKSPQASTMHLARSLSSLSAKDARAVTSSARRLSAAKTLQRSSARLVPQPSDPSASTGNSGAASTCTSRQRPALSRSSLSERRPQASQPTKSGSQITASSSVKLFSPEPIAETEGDVDVDMSPTVQHSSPSASTSAAATSPPRVSSLLVTGNQPQFRRTFESIKALALNNTGCQWKVVCSILSRMPNLEELHLSLNNYEKIDLEPQDFKHFSLKRLYLCNNPKLTNFDELNKLLLAFPSLEALSIADCNISQIPDNLNMLSEWKRICGLNINGWPIKEWPIIERLNQLPSLIDLKCRNLEILSTIDEPRHHLIARLPKLQRLNGSEIEEREHAEKEFLKFFMTNSHLERPSRFHELIQIHGEIKPSVDVDLDLSPPSQAQVKVIYLNRNYFKTENEDDILMSEDFLTRLMGNIDSAASAIASDDQNSSMDIIGQSRERFGSKQPTRVFKDDGQEVLAIEIDLRQSVRKFKSSLADLFGLSSQNLILYYIDHEMVGLMGPELIKHNQKKLWNYNVQDGDQFIVEER